MPSSFLSDDSPAVEYRAVPGWPGYDVGSDGSMWTRRKRGRGAGKLYDERRPVKQTVLDSGRRQVCLYRGDKKSRKKLFVHRLVLLAFVGPCPEGLECCHWDGDHTNNKRDNLRWGTRADNIADLIRHHQTRRGDYKLGESHHKAKLSDDQVREVRELYSTGDFTQTELGRVFNAHTSTIHLIVRNKQRHLVKEG